MSYKKIAKTYFLLAVLSKTIAVCADKAMSNPDNENSMQSKIVNTMNELYGMFAISTIASSMQAVIIGD